MYDKDGSECNKSSVSNPWGFASKRYDEETGFVYFSRRYYAPKQGRWETPDPLGFADGPNLYAYVHNNPMTKFDLYGLYGLMDDDDFDLNAQVASAQFLEHFAVEFAIAEAHAAVGLVSLGVGAARYTAALACNPQKTIDQTRQVISNISLESLAYSTIEDFKNDPAKALANVASTLTNPTSGLTKSAKSKVLAALGKEEKIHGITNNVTKDLLQANKGAPLEAKLPGSAANGELNKLNNKLRSLEKAQQEAVATRVLPDGRIRYDGPRALAKTPGPTKDAGMVTEFDPLTGKTRGWYECRDHNGKVNRVHPKHENGQHLDKPHYPPTARDQTQ